MKILVGVLTVFFLLLGLSAYSLTYLDKTSNTLLEKTEAIEQSLEAKKWDLAEKKLYMLETHWEKAKEIWPVLIDHQEIDNIEMAISRAKQFLKNKEFPELMAELAELKLFLKHIPEKERLNIKNVL